MKYTRLSSWHYSFFFIIYLESSLHCIYSTTRYQYWAKRTNMVSKKCKGKLLKTLIISKNLILNFRIVNVQKKQKGNL
jgi:hypothetical protein